MKPKLKKVLLISGLLIKIICFSCSRPIENPFWGDGEEAFEMQKIYDQERFPNVVVAMDGSVITTWGSKTYQVRRSEDGGNTWSSVISLAETGPNNHGGGVTVDENSGAIFAFYDEIRHGRSVIAYKSTDHGKSWEKEDIVIYPDIKGNTPSTHINESGITLKYGKHAGRLIRATRDWAGSNARDNWPNHYTNAIYSDDGGKTWHTSAPFPAYGTGEAALAELSDGRIYYNSRRHWAPEGVDARRRWSAFSYDGGKTWEDLSIIEELPDGAQHRDYGLMGGLVRLPLDDHDILLFSNIDSPEGRKNGTVWASFDGGKTWPVKRLVEEGGFAYSSLAAGREGTPSEGWIYLLFEGREDTAGHGYIVRFNLPWVTGGRDWKEFLNN